MTIDQLEHDGERMRAAANQAADAIQQLARAANGNNGHVIPGPVAYDLLGNITLILAHLQEVTDYLPRGVEASLTDPRIQVYDRHFDTGEHRDPKAQLHIASHELHAVTAALAAAGTHAAEAQVALNSQGYDPAQP